MLTTLVSVFCACKLVLTEAISKKLRYPTVKKKKGGGEFMNRAICKKAFHSLKGVKRYLEEGL